MNSDTFMNEDEDEDEVENDEIVDCNCVIFIIAYITIIISL